MKTIHLNFLGKDSVEFDSDVEIPDDIYTLLMKYQQGKKPDDRMFTHANADTVNILLKTIMPEITVKNLRTVKANQEFIDAAKNILAKSTPKSEIDKIRVFYLANKAVAEKLNHQKNIAKNYKESAEKLKEKIKSSEAKAKETMTKIKEGKLKLQIQEEEMKQLFKTQPQMLKIKLAEIKVKKQKLSDRETRTKLAIERAKFSYEKKSGTKEIALGTSLASYIDPRVVFSLCKDIDLNPGKIYSKKQLELFDMFSNVDANFYKEL